MWRRGSDWTDSLYAAVRPARTPRHDPRLWIAIAVAVVFMLASAAPMVWAAHYQRQYRLFSTDLADSSLYARQHGCLSLERDGETFPLETGADYDRFLFLLVDTGSGRVGKAPEEAPAATLDFGNGARLALWSVKLEGYLSNDREYGLYLRYTYAGGKTYGYDTENLDPVVMLRLLEQSVVK